MTGKRTAVAKKSLRRRTNERIREATFFGFSLFFFPCFLFGVFSRFFFHSNARPRGLLGAFFPRFVRYFTSVIYRTRANRHQAREPPSSMQTTINYQAREPPSSARTAIKHANHHQLSSARTAIKHANHHQARKQPSSAQTAIKHLAR